MQPNHYTGIRMFVLVSLMLNGCASFEPGLRHQDLTRPRQPTAREIQDGLEVSVEEFVSASKSLQAFDADLAPNGVLPILLRIENKSVQNYKVRENDVQVFLDQASLPKLIGGEASDQAASSEYAGKAFLWTVAAGPFAALLWPSTIAASATHTHTVNRRIRQHFENLEFTDVLLKPGQTAAGFLYFKVPAGVKTVANLAVEVELIAEQDEQRLSFRLPLPTLEISKEVSK